MPYENTCRKCLRSFPLAASLRRHLAHSLPCKQAHYDAFQKRFSQYRRHEQQFRGELTSETREANALGAQPAGIIGEEAGEEGDGMDVYEPRESRGRATVEDVDDQPELSVPGAARGGEGSHGERAWEEGTEEVDPSLLHVRLFPTQDEAGKVYGEDQTVFEVIRNQQESEKRDAHSPFADREEWDLAKWLVKNVGHNATEEFLRLPAVRNRIQASFPNKDELYKIVDALPQGAVWKSQLLKVTGDVKGLDGAEIVEELELWYRDPVECIRELIGNPLFRDSMSYAPEQLFEDPGGRRRVWNQMSSGDWWWKVQLQLPNGATCAPIIISTDKTKLSQFRGDKSAWPIYLTIGNIDKEVRRQSSSHATILLGYIPVPKLDCCTEKTKKVTRYNLFHQSMRLVLSSLVDAGRSGVMMTCADAKVRNVFPILAAYVADYPEQCLVACCMETRCPMCTVAPDKRGEHQDGRAYITRSPEDVLELLRQASVGTVNLRAHGLRPTYPPFWKDLPHSNIFTCFTPDLLHQLHKGVFKDHLVEWCSALISEEELDDRFRAIPSHRNLRHFKNGISSVSQWTGREHKEMQKVFAGILAGAVDSEVMRAVSALLDFIYFASFHSHSSHTLDSMQKALEDFHSCKDVFIRLSARQPAHFNIPKIHSLQHYRHMIESFGAADGYSTEAPERLHIDYAKEAYRASNKRDYVPQMVNWLRRQEAVHLFDAYLAWRSGKSGAPRLPEQSGRVILQTSPSQLTPRATSRIANRPPQELQHVVGSQIIQGHGATQFLPALTRYLRENHCAITPQAFDTFDLYKQVVVDLPAIPETGQSHCNDVIRATPPVAQQGRVSAEPGEFDFALVRTTEQNARTSGSALQGLRTAQVRVLFELPGYFHLHVTEPLAYIEWLTPFHSVHADSGFYTLSRSSRMHLPHAEIVPVSRLARSCHLIPQFGRVKDPRWTSENARDLCTTFYFNHYLDYHLFAMVKAGKRYCI